VSTRCFIVFVFLSTTLHAQIQSPGEYSVTPVTRVGDRPVAATVSLYELEHPIPEKALRAVYESQRYAQENNTRKAIEKLEEAVRLAPSYRDAHNDLGVQYAQARRFTEARAEFQTALEIGPPAAPIYVNLALTSAAFGYLGDAEAFARQALRLDASNPVAQKMLRYVSAH
jgi:Flp pilus assembly protein TadD